MVMFINLVLIPYLRKNENASKKEFGGTLMEQVIYSNILQDQVYQSYGNNFLNPKMS